MRSDRARAERAVAAERRRHWFAGLSISSWTPPLHHRAHPPNRSSARLLPLRLPEEWLEQAPAHRRERQPEPGRRSSSPAAARSSGAAPGGGEQITLECLDAKIEETNVNHLHRTLQESEQSRGNDGQDRADVRDECEGRGDQRQRQASGMPRSQRPAAVSTPTTIMERNLPISHQRSVVPIAAKTSSTRARRGLGKRRANPCT